MLKALSVLMLIAAHSVSLSWTNSTSVVVSYNVYRSTSSCSGPFTKIGTVSQVRSFGMCYDLLVPDWSWCGGPAQGQSSYVDNDVTAGQTYFYATTAVDSTGTESRTSNCVQASVPTP